MSEFKGITKFQIGNCVSLPKPEWSREKGFTESNKLYFGSSHILSKRDIDRGYYWCNNGNSSVKLSLCELSTPVLNYTNRCQTLKGRSTKPLGIKRYVDHIDKTCSKRIGGVCYINWKGNSMKVEGVLSNDKRQLYFLMNKDFYKTKTYVDSEGFLRGLTKTTPLGAKQKRNSTRFLIEDKT